MSWVWSKLNFISEGYHLMLLLHIVVFWLGIIAWNYGVKNSTKINVFFYFRFFAMGNKFSRSYLERCWYGISFVNNWFSILSKNKNSIFEIIIIFFLLSLCLHGKS